MPTLRPRTFLSSLFSSKRGLAGGCLSLRGSTVVDPCSVGTRYSFVRCYFVLVSLTTGIGYRSSRMRCSDRCTPGYLRIRRRLCRGVREKLYGVLFCRSDSPDKRSQGYATYVLSTRVCLRGNRLIGYLGQCCGTFRCKILRGDASCKFGK